MTPTTCHWSPNLTFLLWISLFFPLGLNSPLKDRSSTLSCSFFTVICSELDFCAVFAAPVTLVPITGTSGLRVHHQNLFIGHKYNRLLLPMIKARHRLPFSSLQTEFTFPSLANRPISLFAQSPFSETYFHTHCFVELINAELNTTADV